MTKLLLLNPVNGETDLISLRAYYFGRVADYWREFHNDNFDRVEAIYAELKFYSEHQVNLWFDSGVNVTNPSRVRLLLFFLPAILGAILVSLLLFVSYKELLPANTSSQVTYNINLIELLVGGAVAFAALLASTTYTVKNITRYDDGGGGDGVPPKGLRPFPLPPKPNKLRELKKDS